MTSQINTSKINQGSVHPRLTEETLQAIQLFRAHLANAKLKNISRVLLYGSRVQGNHRPDSDIDIAVIFHQKCTDSHAQHNLQKCLALIDTRTMTESKIPVSSIPLWEDWLDHPEQQKNPTFFHNLKARNIDINELI